MPKIMKIGWQ